MGGTSDSTGRAGGGSAAAAGGGGSRAGLGRGRPGRAARRARAVRAGSGEAWAAEGRHPAHVRGGGGRRKSTSRARPWARHRLQVRRARYWLRRVRAVAAGAGPAVAVACAGVRLFGDSGVRSLAQWSAPRPCECDAELGATARAAPRRPLHPPAFRRGPGPRLGRECLSR